MEKVEVLGVGTPDWTLPFTVGAIPLPSKSVGPMRGTLELPVYPNSTTSIYVTVSEEYVLFVKRIILSWLKGVMLQITVGSSSDYIKMYGYNKVIWSSQAGLKIEPGDQLYVSAYNPTNQIIRITGSLYGNWVHPEYTGLKIERL